MPDNCTVIHASTEEMAREENDYKFKVQNAVAKLIGTPNKSAMRTAKKVLDEFPTKKNKQKYDMETLRYIEHIKLRDEMTEYTMKTGKEANYNLELANPDVMIDSWRAIFNRRRVIITPKTIVVGPRRIPALRALVRRITNKREQLSKNNKLQRAELRT